MQAAKIIDFQRLAIGSVNLQDGTYHTEFLFSQRVLDFPMGSVQRIDGSAIEPVVRSKTSQRFQLDALEGMEPRFPRAGAHIAAGQRYFLGVPLIVGDEVVGALGFNRARREAGLYG